MNQENQVKQFVDSIFDDRIWHLRDEEYQKEMVRLWIGLAFEEGRAQGAKSMEHGARSMEHGVKKL